MVRHGFPVDLTVFILAKKKNGSIRLVVDFRAVYDATICYEKSLPLINYIFQKHGQFKIRSVLDMKDWFHQIPMKK